MAVSFKNNSIFHIEPVAAVALDKKYAGKPVPETLPAAEEQAMIGYSIAISLKRIADAIDGDKGKWGVHRAILDIADHFNIPK
jgi:hypothetical protein